MATLRANSLTSAAAKPYVVRAFEAMPNAALSTGNVYRLADRFAIESNEHFYMSSQLIRVVCNRLVEREPERYFRRLADERDADLYRPGYKIWLFSMTNPVPVWEFETRRRIREIAPRGPRKNPSHKNTGVPAGGHNPRRSSDSSERAALICQLVNALAEEADSGISQAQAQRTIENLNAQVKQLRIERDDAHRQIRQIAKAQQTIAALVAPVKT